MPVVLSLPPRFGRRSRKGRRRVHPAMIVLAFAILFLLLARV
jgi:hypothetical protein